MIDGEETGGRKAVTITVVPYDPRWLERYRDVETSVREVLGADAELHHIGSTSVPGLAAKPVVDVLLVLDPEVEEAYVPALQEIGLELRVREPGHRMLRTPQGDVHLHVRAEGSAAVREHLALRDRLRASEQDRELYAATKRALAEQDWPDVDAYAEAKTDVIREVLARAPG